MSDILNNLDKKLDRRSFLRGSGLVAATALGVAAAGRALFAQEPQQQPQQQQGQQQQGDGSSSDSSSDSETKTDSQGRPYRVCPQCGGNMYQQGRTWTCENCGYSYVE